MSKNLDTGDIILCHGDTGDDMIDTVIEDITHSPYIHAGIIIKDPTWLNLTGTYILQSNRGPNSYRDVINNNISGVTLNKLDEFLIGRQFVCVRILKNVNWNNYNNKLFESIFHKVHGKPYDKNACHWICTGVANFFKCKCLSNNTVPKDDKHFWCSALVSYIYVQMGWCNKDIDWTCQTPQDLTQLKVLEPLMLGKVYRLK